MFRFALALFAVVLLAVPACKRESTDATASIDAAKFVLMAEPAGALSVADARRLVSGKDSGDHPEHDGHDHEAEAGDKKHDAHEHAGHDHDDHAHEKGISKEVVVVGRIGGVPDPWDKGRAAFFISETTHTPEAHDHGSESHDEDDHGDHAHDHAGHNHAPGEHCAFCDRAKGLDSTAIVQFVDSTGKALPVDARELFGLTADQTVIVRGRATLDAIGNLLVTADGIYLPQK